MPIPRLPRTVASRFERLPETGMGFHYVLARYAQYNDDAGFLVIGATYVLPVRPYGSLTSLASLSEAIDLDAQSEVEPVSIEIVQDFADKREDARFLMLAELRRVTLGFFGAAPTPPPPPGTPLVLKTVTSGDDAFLRFSYTSKDPRTSSKIVQPGTYATTYRDGVAVNSGFSAVARYALPVPLAAKHVMLLTPPTGTAVELGAAGPLFGQSGGGVEAYFPNSFTNVSRSFALPAY